MISRRSFTTDLLSYTAAAVGGVVAVLKLNKECLTPPRSQEWQAGYAIGRDVGEVKSHCLRLLDAMQSHTNLVAIGFTIDNTSLAEAQKYYDGATWFHEYMELRSRPLVSSPNQTHLELHLRPQYRTVQPSVEAARKG